MMHASGEKVIEESIPAAQEDAGEHGTGIDVRGVIKTFAETPAVRNVSFQVPDGQFCTLLGPSGCGKTTTLRLIAGLDRADAGTIWIRNRLVSGPRRHVPADKRHIGFVFQAYALWPHMSVFDQVAYPLRVHGKPKAPVDERVAEVLAIVGLGHESHRYPAELSGGQQQRVALARALVGEPDVLLLDEPLSNLDTELRAQMRKELHRLHQQIGITTVYVTHDQMEALSLSDIVVFMQHGDVVEIGGPTEMYERPSRMETAVFIGGANTVYGTIVDSAPERARIRLRDGTTVTARAGHPGLEPGDPAVLAVKPVDIVDSLGTEPNRIVGTVVSRLYFGGHVLMSAVVDGVEWHAHASRSNSTRPGDTIRLTFQEERALIYRDSRASTVTATDNGSIDAL
jgi:ABC-type Fe3+/spermidine/putrescine transport system ATPase subunit